MNRRRKAEHGSVVVEASIVLPVFMIAVFLVINMVNVFAVHNRVQFALNATAHELASYSYLYSALHLNDAEQTLENDGKPYTSKIDQASNNILDCLNQIQTLKSDAGELSQQVNNPELSLDYADGIKDQTQKVYGDVENVAESGKNAYEDVKGLVTDPKGTAIGAGYMLTEAGIYQLKRGAAAVLAKTLMQKYLELDGQSADAYLKRYGVSGGYDSLKFTGSSILNDTGSIHKGHRLVDLVVEYDIDLSAFHLVLGQEKLHIVQRVTIPAWQDGDGVKPPDK